MNKILKNLTAEGLTEFFEACSKEKGLTLERIQELASQRGIEISLMSAKNFRDNAWATYTSKLQRANEASAQIQTLLEEGSVNSFADASATMLGQMVFDILMSGDKGLDINGLSKIVARLRSGDHRQRELEMKIAEYERAEAERKKQVEALKAKTARAKEGGGLSEERLKEIEEAINLL